MPTAGQCSLFHARRMYILLPHSFVKGERVLYSSDTENVILLLSACIPLALFDLCPLKIYISCLSGKTKSHIRFIQKYMSDNTFCLKVLALILLFISLYKWFSGCDEWNHTEDRVKEFGLAVSNCFWLVDVEV